VIAKKIKTDTRNHPVIGETKSNSELYLNIFKSFYAIVKTAFDEIGLFNPKIIIPLEHRGWGVLWAMEDLWFET